MKNNISNLFIEQENIRFRHIIVMVLLIMIPLLIYATGGTKNVYVHLMYIPIVISAIERRQIMVLLVAILAGLFVGPFMPVDVIQGQMQLFQNWLLRMGMFVFVGEIVYLLYRKSNNELYATKLVLQSITEGICVINEHDHIIFVNDIFTTMHDLSKEDLVGENIFTFLHNNYKEEIGNEQSNELINAIKNRTQVENLLVPKLVNSYGETLSEYSVRTTKAHGLYNSIIVVRNIEAKLNYNRYLHKLSYTDTLTGVPNRRGFRDHIETLKDNKILPLGVLFVDIDGIKFINDSFGHQKGDEVIMMVSYIINNTVKKLGYVARLDGDEFIGLIHQARSKNMDDIVDKIKTEVSKIEINSLQMKVSCGYSLVDNIGDLYDAIKTSENNMYIDKNTSNNSMRSNPIDTIMNTLHEKDAYSEQHSMSVSEISANIATALSLPGNKVKEIHQAALLHDIGKIIVPIDILTKKDKLTNEEYSKMKEHSEIGYRLLSTMKNLNEIPNMVLYHHERWDGTGYPHQIKKNNIPIGARIISVADTFNAMTTNRPYRNKMTKEEALKEIVRCRGTQFDPMIIDIFERNFESIVS